MASIWWGARAGLDRRWVQKSTAVIFALALLASGAAVIVGASVSPGWGFVTLIAAAIAMTSLLLVILPRLEGAPLKRPTGNPR